MNEKIKQLELEMDTALNNTFDFDCQKWLDCWQEYTDKINNLKSSEQLKLELK